jgi:hypothetical protein
MAAFPRVTRAASHETGGRPVDNLSLPRTKQQEATSFQPMFDA